jgi:PEP-CTERM/exosortase A-associated glycosyltransferase
MRILHIFDHSLPLQSGYVTRSLGIIASQRLRGWETIHLTTPRHQAATIDSEHVDGLEFHRTPPVASKLPVIREFLETRATTARVIELAKRQRPDVIHAHSPVLNALAGISAGRRLGIPVVYEVRALWEDAAVDHGTSGGSGPRYRLSRAVDTWAMRRASFVAPICEPLREEIIGRGIDTGKVAVVPNAVDRGLLATGDVLPPEPQLLAELGAAGKTVLGFVGSFYGYEGLDLLLAAAKRVSAHRRDFLVLLVGGGPEEERLKAQVRDLGLDDYVRFTGRVHHSEVGRYYRVIDLLVFPRKRSRLTDLVTPLKPLEAMAQRKPLLASDVGGHRELIRHEATGFLFRADDVGELTRCVEDLLDNPAKRTSVIAPGREFVEQERTWDRLCDRYAEIYAQLGVRT